MPNQGLSSLRPPSNFGPQNAWQDDEGELATEPIDVDKNSKSSLMQTLQQLLQIKDQMKYVTDIAFEAVDADHSNSLDRQELFDIMREVAQEMNVTPPGDDDIFSVLQQLDENQDGDVGKDEFE